MADKLATTCVMSLFEKSPWRTDLTTKDKALAIGKEIGGN
jgi:hypothetical protein